MEYSVGLPVVNRFLMVEHGNSKGPTKMDCSDPWMEDSQVTNAFVFNFSLQYALRERRPVVADE